MAIFNHSFCIQLRVFLFGLFCFWNPKGLEPRKGWWRIRLSQSKIRGDAYGLRFSFGAALLNNRGCRLNARYGDCKVSAFIISLSVELFIGQNVGPFLYRPSLHRVAFRSSMIKTQLSVEFSPQRLATTHVRDCQDCVSVHHRARISKTKETCQLVDVSLMFLWLIGLEKIREWMTDDRCWRLLY